MAAHGTRRTPCPTWIRPKRQKLYRTDRIAAEQHGQNRIRSHASHSSDSNSKRRQRIMRTVQNNMIIMPHFVTGVGYKLVHNNNNNNNILNYT